MEESDRVRSHNFFRARLITLTDNDELYELLQVMKQEQHAIHHTTIRIMWHMRGSLSREEAWSLSPDERNEIMKLIEEHKDMTEKTGLPLL
jgi:hypothetical protein